jgi:hypothetical protein
MKFGFAVVERKEMMVGMCLLDGRKMVAGMAGWVPL